MTKRAILITGGSRGAFRGEVKSPAHGSSKAAIVVFGQSIAQALAPMKIGVTTLAPGFVETKWRSFGLQRCIIFMHVNYFANKSF